MKIAVAYLRMSTDDQTTSIEIQKNEILKVFADRFTIIEWYVDEGRSGSHSAEKRLEFQRLLKDAERKQFQVVLCYDLSRFSRQDAIEAASAKKVLRDNGIGLITVLEGESDWETSTGRIVDSVMTEAQHEYSVKLSKRVIDGKKLSFEKKDGVPGQVTPYGYSRLITDPSGIQRVVPRTERFERPKGWRQTFIPGEDSEVEIVRWLFDEFNTRDVSFQRLATELNGKGVPSPNGQKWNYMTIHDILINVRYAGGLSFGKNATGKHHRLVGGEVVKNSDHETHCRKKAGFLVQYDTHEAIVARDLFDAVQIKVQRRWRTGKHASRDFALTGVLYCGHCQKPLYGNEREGSGKHKKGVRYICKGLHRGSDCGQWGVREDEILPFIIKTVIKHIDQQELLKSQIKLPAPRTGDVKGLKKQLSKLKSERETNWDRFLSAKPGKFANELQIRLDRMEEKISRLEQEIDAKETPESTKELWNRRFAFLNELRGKLINVQYLTTKDCKYGASCTMTKAALRELLHRADVRVDLWWERTTPHRYRLVRGRLRAGGHATDIDPAQYDNPASLIV